MATRVAMAAGVSRSKVAAALGLALLNGLVSSRRDEFIACVPACAMPVPASP